MNHAQWIAQRLLDIEAVIVRPNDPFTWASGLKSPIYCDNRILISDTKGRKRTQEAFKELIRDQKWNLDLIAGTATAGIPHASWLSWSLDLPMVYVRSSAKKHGKQNAIEGRIKPGQKTIVVEDLISTGKSSIQSVNALREAGCDVIAVVSIFSYELTAAKDAFKEAEIAYFSLSNYDELIDLLDSNKQLTSPEKETLLLWKQDPHTWSERNKGAE